MRHYVKPWIVDEHDNFSDFIIMVGSGEGEQQNLSVSLCSDAREDTRQVERFPVDENKKSLAASTVGEVCGFGCLAERAP